MEDTQPTQVLMSEEMLQNLISGIIRNQTSEQKGNFSQCTARFSGTSDVNTFVENIKIYKSCVNISDENALKGLPMLLQGNAAVWWQGVKLSIKTFVEAIEALISAYGVKKPPYQIYQELFSRQQEETEKTDIFVSRARALFAQLPVENKCPSVCQIDMVYGLLNYQIRKRVPRNSCDTFDNLLKLAREVEITLSEKKPKTETSKTIVNDDIATYKKNIRCAYCKNFGHLKDACRKLKRHTSMTETQKQPTEHITTENITDQKKKVEQPLVPRSATISCYGCGKLGFIKSACPNCKPASSRFPNTPNPNTSVQSSEFFSNSFSDDSIPRSMVSIQILGHNGLACIDTGAKRSLAGAMLTKILLDEQVPYTQQELTMTLADGVPRKVNALNFDVEIILNHKIIPLTLLSIPDHTYSRTLLGLDFISLASIVIDLPNGEWFFSEAPQFRYLFEDEEICDVPAINNVTTVTPVLNIRPNEAVHLSEEDKAEVNSFLVEYKEVFVPSLEATPYIEHTIKLTDTSPISVPPYRMSEPNKKVLHEELNRLLQEDIIEECESPYAAPVVLVPKPNGSIRLCVNYQSLNEITVSDKYPLPRIDDLLHSAKQSAYMSTLDLRAGYHQISVRPSDRDKTAFICPFGTYRWKRMPFGLKNSPSTFMRLIDRFRAGLQDVSILAYLDDLIIISQSFKEHLEDLRKVFDRLLMFKLRLNRDKCYFIKESIKYLGHLITPQGIRPDPGKVAAILERPCPKDGKQLLSFLQTCSWFRRFIPSFAEVSRPLSILTKKNAKWKWGYEQQQSFHRLIQLLTSSPILIQADSRMPYVLRTDASAYAIGAVLLQGEGEAERPVEYASRLLNPAEMNYHTTEREALAVVWAVEKFRGYLEGSSFVIQTDHQPLKWLMSLKSPTGRLARWSLSLQPYDMKIDYTPGKSNVVADTLSRPPIEKSNIEIQAVHADFPKEKQAEVRAAQLADPDIEKIINCFESPDPVSVDFKSWTDRGYLMSQGILYRASPDYDGDEFQQVVPNSHINKILQDYHDSPLAGHYGVEKTLQRIRSRYYWIGMRKSVTEYLAKCLDCQRYKIRNQKPAGLLQTPVMAQRFEVIAIDLFGPLPETPTGEKWIFVVEDTASRWVELFPLVNATAESCARTLIDEVILRFGTPRRVTSDNGVQFISDTMQYIAHCLGFKQHLIPVYHAESNPVERKNRDLKTQLSIMVKNTHTDWKEKLPAIRFAMNTALCDSVGYSPAYLTFGRELRTPDDVQRDMRVITESDNFTCQVTPYLLSLADTLREAREKHEQSQDRSHQYANKNRRAAPSYKIGDRVLVDSHQLSNSKNAFTSKFVPKRDGPYIITKVVTPTTYEVANPAKPEESLAKCHSSALIPFIAEEPADPAPVNPWRKRGRPATKQSSSSTARLQPESSHSDQDSIEEHLQQPSPERASPVDPRLRPRRHLKAPTCSCGENAIHQHHFFEVHPRTDVNFKRGDCNIQEDRPERA